MTPEPGKGNNFSANRMLYEMAFIAWGFRAGCGSGIQHLFSITKTAEPNLSAVCPTVRIHGADP
jgi:hypothetical protein